MKMNFNQIQAMHDSFDKMTSMKMPFKLSLIIAKNTAALKTEMDFYTEQERNFVNQYLERDENGELIQTQPGMYKIKDGLNEECVKARQELDSFETDVELRMIPASMLEGLEFEPSTILGIESIIEEQEQE